MPAEDSAHQIATDSNSIAQAQGPGAQATVISYGYTAADVERLIDKVLAFLQAGARFVQHDDVLRAELDGETLTFRPGAAQQLSIRRDEKSYLLSLIVQDRYAVWATKFIPLAGQMDVRPALAKLDMPIAFSEFRLPREGEGPVARETTVPLNDITEALDKHRALVILGEPGAGKTTTLCKIAFESARALLSGKPGPVPLFVHLSQQKGREPFDFIRAEWEQRVGSDCADVLAHGRVLLLADGINELPRGDERAEQLKAWREFTEDYGKANRIIFSGRERDYSNELNLPRVRIEPLDDARIADYVHRNDADSLGEILDDPRTRLREMARNPFNLWLLVWAWHCDQRGMDNHGRLLDWFVGELYTREEMLAHRGWLHRDAQKQALAHLAYTMQEQGYTLFPLKEARAVLPPAVEVNGEEIVIKPADLFRFARAATLLDPALEPDVRFYHHLLQEYFAAIELLKRFGAGEDLSALWKCKRLVDEMPRATVGQWDPLPEPPATGWEVTTILACGLAGDPAKLIDVVRPHNPVLAGRCLDEAGLFTSVASLVPQVRTDLLADLYAPAVHLRARLQAGFTLGRIGDPRFQPEIINGVKVIVPQMVRVLAGDYIIGSAENEPDALDDEKPQHPVRLAAFDIGRWPVTNAEYACFMEAGGYTDKRYWTTEPAKQWLRGEAIPISQFKSFLGFWQWLKSTPDWREKLQRRGRDVPDELEYYAHLVHLNEDEFKAELTQSLSIKSRERPQYWDNNDFNTLSQPVVGVTWFEAQAYCVWLSGVTGRVYRLPTEVEWEAAARGLSSPCKGEGPRGRIYPWGHDWDASRANTIEGRVLKPSPVGAYRAAGGVGPFDAEDQSGNVWNWTSSLYLPYPYQFNKCEDAEAEGERSMRGGSWYDARSHPRCAYRGTSSPANFANDIGFRVMSPGNSICSSIAER